jgi:F-type H+-transporting ATPase subunit gamma
VSRRREIDRRRHSLGEIRGIVNSISTLAYLETRKLARLIPPQESVVAHIEAVAADLLQFHPQVLPAIATAATVCVAVGSERGFCGDFNRSLIERLAAPADAGLPADVRLVLVGRRLQLLLAEAPRIAARVPGASIAEEVPEILNQVVRELVALQARSGPLTVFVMAHRLDGAGPTLTRLLPPFDRPAPVAAPLHEAPELNLAPERFLLELSDQYLLAALNALLYRSLLAENHTRVDHLEGAADHLEQQWLELGRQSNALRQEEIIEEIEVILLSAANPREPRFP